MWRNLSSKLGRKSGDDGDDRQSLLRPLRPDNQVHALSAEEDPMSPLKPNGSPHRYGSLLKLHSSGVTADKENLGGLKPCHAQVPPELQRAVERINEAIWKGITADKRRVRTIWDECQLTMSVIAQVELASSGGDGLQLQQPAAVGIQEDRGRSPRRRNLGQESRAADLDKPAPGTLWYGALQGRGVSVWRDQRIPFELEGTFEPVLLRVPIQAQDGGEVAADPNAPTMKLVIRGEFRKFHLDQDSAAPSHRLEYDFELVVDPTMALHVRCPTARGVLAVSQPGSNSKKDAKRK